MAPKADPVTHPLSSVEAPLTADFPRRILEQTTKRCRELEARCELPRHRREDTSVGNLKYALGRALVERVLQPERGARNGDVGRLRDMCVNHGFFMIRVPVLDFCEHVERARVGDFDDSIP